MHRRHDDGHGLGGGQKGGLWAQGAAGGRVRVMGIVDGHTADHVGPLARSRAAGGNETFQQITSRLGSFKGQETGCSPGSRELPVILILRVAVDGDDADSRAGRVRDDDGLRLVTGEGRSVVDHRGG